MKGLDMKSIISEEGVRLALCAKEKEGGKTELVLFTSLDLDKIKINTILKEAGCSRLVKISRIEKIDGIPLMGTGKIDYRYLQTMLD